jgi:hypothetical protein
VLTGKGHLLRAAEYYGRAAEVARALGEDNLVAVHLLLCQADFLRAYSFTPLNTALDGVSFDPRTLAACRAEAITLLSGAVDVLERRRMADTLLESKCTAIEEVGKADEIQNGHKDVPAAEAARWATLVGYLTVVFSAALALEVLRYPRHFAAECSVGQLQSFAQHVVQAAFLMQQPRHHGGTSAMGVERTFTAALRETVADADGNGLDPRLIQLLAGAWQRLQRSGVLQVRSIAMEDAELDGDGLAADIALLTSMRAPSLRSCALASCGAKEAHPSHFKSCAACRGPVYCCKEHQTEDWPSHKAACKATRKAKTESQAASGGAQ